MKRKFLYLNQQSSLKDDTLALLKQYNLGPKYSWGQNFLINAQVIEMMVEAAQLKPADLVIELGAGLGLFSQRLEKLGKNLVLIEKERDMVQILTDKFAQNPKVEIIAENILAVDLKKIADKYHKKPFIIGNIPYNISSQILIHLTQYSRSIKAGIFMLQKEMADRVVAVTPSPHYSRLSVMLQLYFDLKILFPVHRESFFPKPKVNSAVILVRPFKRSLAKIQNKALFGRIVQISFNYRRKTLRNSFLLDPCFANLDFPGISEKSGIDLGRRGESLNLSEFIRLYETIHQFGRG